jgi:arsenite/tail-anchored protein-transporting ATPase
VDSSTPLPDLIDMVARRDLVLVTGKGGTGKSTVVAALARMAAARRGGAVAVEVAVHPRLATMVGEGRQVDVVNIELDRALPRALSRLLKVPKIVGSMMNNRVLRLFVRTSPAVEETVLLDELFELVQECAERGWPVIVDLPSAGHAVTLLDTPRSVRQMLRVGPVATKVARIEELLLDPERCQLVVVALPEELPVNETIELVRKAAELGMAPPKVLVNRVPVSQVDDGDRGLIDLLRTDSNIHLSAAGDAAHGDLAGVDEARIQIARLRAALVDPVLEIPISAHTDPAGRTEEVERSLDGI